MIVAGLVLLAVGLSDLVRQFAPRRRRWIVLAVVAIAFFVLSAGADAAPAALLGIGVASAWLAVSPADGSGRAGLWPAALLALIAAASVAVVGPRADTGPLGELWPNQTPLGAVPLDATVLVLGVLVFLLESANVIVRTALRIRPDAAADAASVPAAPAPAASAPAPAASAAAAPPVTAPLRGGRLIGPLERILVFALTLTGAYTLIAAVFAAKGIVRFPEISQDGEHGGRAEYFLVGSLVSWVTALAAAFLVWWAVR
ncbi:hypothetical protein [Microbacterium sp. RU33B]|uniref:hypothetical protein n=1 Tax=Microbacterium sp. RU33B TaxID=1907390 RepID=UPI00095DCDC9|nr:hypothetical protein [Microbacterium sp. RU33B]SIT77333.1 hypothetical protein SAMN05880545_1733 [Microbacterium sp. RU33B]